MTTRPMGRQAPQRSVSSTNAIQRPPPHRTLSQQFPSSSPTRRGSDNFVDLTFDGDTGRHAPRIGTSRLRLEISTDSKTTDLYESPRPSSASTPTWKPSMPPRGRPQLHFDVPSVSNHSPRPSQDGTQNEVAIKPMPVPVRPGKHAPPPAEKSRPLTTALVRKDVRPKPYTLEVPAAAPRYTPNGQYSSSDPISLLTYPRPCRLLSVDWKPPRGPVFRVYHSPGLFRQSPDDTERDWHCEGDYISSTEAQDWSTNALIPVCKCSGSAQSSWTNHFGIDFQATTACDSH